MQKVIRSLFTPSAVKTVTRERFCRHRQRRMMIRSVATGGYRWWWISLQAVRHSLFPLATCWHRQNAAVQPANTLTLMAQSSRTTEGFNICNTHTPSSHGPHRVVARCHSMPVPVAARATTIFLLQCTSIRAGRNRRRHEAALTAIVKSHCNWRAKVPDHACVAASGVVKTRWKRSLINSRNCRYISAIDGCLQTISHWFRARG